MKDHRNQSLHQYTKSQSCAEIYGAEQASPLHYTRYPNRTKHNHDNKEIGFKLADMAFQGLMQASLYGL